jgi:hypothetical protein
MSQTFPSGPWPRPCLPVFGEEQTMAILLGITFAAFAATSVVADVGPGATIVGTVSLMVADESTSPGEGARVVLACSSERMTRTEVADQHGAFRFLNVPVDNCSIAADVQGFMAPPLWIVTAAGATVSTDLHLGIAPLRVGLDVEGAASFAAPKVPHGSCVSNARRPDDRAATRCARGDRQRRRSSFLQKGHRDVTSND